MIVGVGNMMREELRMMGRGGVFLSACEEVKVNLLLLGL